MAPRHEPTPEQRRKNILLGLALAAFAGLVMFWAFYRGIHLVGN